MRAVARLLQVLLVALALVGAVLHLGGCGPRPWPVTAHAVINAHAHALAAADAVVAEEIRRDPETDPARLSARWEPVVTGLRASRRALLTAESAVDGASAVQDAPEHCRALQAVAEAGTVVSQVALLLRAARVQVPVEVPQLARVGGALGEAMARECAASSDGGVR